MRKHVTPISEFAKGLLVGAALVCAMIWAIVLLSGCSTVSMSTPDGYHASYTRVGNQNISGLRFEKSEGGLYRLVLDKQSSDSDVLGLIRQLVAQ